MKKSCKEKSPMIGKCRLVTALILALVCVSMWGCSSWFDEDDHLSVNEKRTNGYLVAILDDSLAIVQNRRGWEIQDDYCGNVESCKGTMNPGIFLVNYRNKQEPLWGDTVEGRISIVEGYYRDSSTLFSTIDDEFGFWRIGEKPRVVRKWNCEAPCECNREKYGRPWVDGKVLLKIGWPRECPYAILDTATGSVNKLELTGEYAWLDGCDDITYIDGEVVCLRQRGDRLCEIDFEKKEGVVDSLIKSEWMLFDPPEIYGNAVKMKASSFDKNNHAYDFGDRLALIGINGFVFEGYPETWMKYNSFVDSTGSSISYSSEDLIITK